MLQTLPIVLYQTNEIYNHLGLAYDLIKNLPVGPGSPHSTPGHDGEQRDDE